MSGTTGKRHLRLETAITSEPPRGGLVVVSKANAEGAP